MKRFNQYLMEAEIAADPQSALPEAEAATLDSAEGFKAALVKVATNAGGDGAEIAQNVDKMVVAAPDGSVDAEQTLVKIMSQFGDAMPQIVKMVEDMIAAFVNAMRAPEFATLDAETKQSVQEALAEMKAQLPVLKRKAQEMATQMQTAQSQLSQKQAQPAAAPPAPVSEELDRWLQIAGLR